MRVLILGKGYLGNKIFNHLKSSKRMERCVLLSQKDVIYSNSEELYPFLMFRDEKIYDVIINASGYTGRPNIDAAEDDKETCWKYNVSVPMAICDAAEKAKIPMIHISSGCIYNDVSESFKWFSEDDEPNFGMFNDESSFYSKTKHVAEMMLKDRAWLFRIRMPFSKDNIERNYLRKILAYDNLISIPNSMTCVEDFCVFIEKFLESNLYTPFGTFNVVNNGFLTAKNVVDIMQGYFKMNKSFIDLSELETKANRSNCLLSDNKISGMGLMLPNAYSSMVNCVEGLADEFATEYNKLYDAAILSGMAK